MLSRVADSIYWMARYVERAENLARFIDVTLNVIPDQPDLPPQWSPLISVTGEVDQFKEHCGDIMDQESVIRFLALNREYPNSIVSSLRAARENARTIRETISSETWEQLNCFYHFVRDSNAETVLADPASFFAEVKRQSHLFCGITDSTMTHDEGWHFLSIGRLLERADKTSRLLDVKYYLLLPRLSDVGTTVDDLQWSSLLRSVSGLEMYRKRYRGITVHRVVDFLVLGANFPRAIRYCINQADQSLHAITGSPDRIYRNPAERRLGQLRSRLEFLDPKQIVDNGMHEFIDSLQIDLNEVDSAIVTTFSGEEER